MRNIRRLAAAQIVDASATWWRQMAVTPGPRRWPIPGDRASIALRAGSATAPADRRHPTSNTRAPPITGGPGSKADRLTPSPRGWSISGSRPGGLASVRVPRISACPSRGCCRAAVPWRCAYGGSAALQRAVEEGLRAGVDLQTLAQHGVGGTRRRSPERWPRKWRAVHGGARFFVLLDDNLLGGEPPRAANWLRSCARN